VDRDGHGRASSALAVTVIAVTLAAAGAVADGGWGPGWAVVAYLGPVALITVWAVLLVADRVESLQRQLVLAGAVTVTGLVVSVALFVDAMYVSQHDALFTFLLAGYGLVIGGWSALLLGRRALRRLADAERARGDVVAAVSHDLRTPITAMRLLAEAIDDDIIDAGTRHEYLGRMTTHVRALSALIDDLFELSRLEAGDIHWSMQRVRLDSLVEETVDALRPHADAGGVTMRAEVAPGLPPIRGDPERLQRVLFNLIENAIRHTPSGGNVAVRAQPDRRHVQVEVADTGVGIPEDERGSVFEAFYRGRAHAARGDPGAGLGLAISRAIVEAHGGRIWLAGSGPGTRVRFSFPIAGSLGGSGRIARRRRPPDTAARSGARRA
jgi:signal transduction histidine kinase